MSTDQLEPVAILWDIENCGVPHGVNAEDVSLHVRMALKFQLAVRGPLTMFSAYGDFSRLPIRTRQGCQKTGVNLIDVPHGTKDAADKAILVDMFLFALDNPPPCTLVLITGDVDFAPALHKLGQRGYSVVLVVPSGRNVSPALLNACHHLWSWPDIARGNCALPMDNLLPQPFHQNNGKQGTFPSIINYPKKIAATCAGTVGNKPSEAVGTAVGSFGSEGSTLFKSAPRDHQISMTIPPYAEGCMDCQVKGNNHSVNHCSDWVKKNPNFGKLEMGPPNSTKIAFEAPSKIPVDMFEECVEIPFYAIKESPKIPITMGVDQNCMGTTEILALTSHGMAGSAKDSEISMLMDMDRNSREVFGMNTSVFRPFCSFACPVASNSMTGYENASHAISQSMDGCIRSSNFIFSGGEHVSNQYVPPNPDGLIGAFGVRKDGFEHIYAQGFAARSQSNGQLFTNFKCSKTAGKQAARAKGRGQDPSQQLKVKKKKRKKANKMSNVKAAPAAAPNLTKKQRKSARLAAIQRQSTKPNSSLEHCPCEAVTDKVC